jgi:drug/metabolite transporter (DMT)-like permease
LNKDILLTSVSQIEKISPTNNQTKLIKNSFSLGVLAIAVIALAFSPIFTKLSEIEISPAATIFNRLWITTIILSGWQLSQTPKDFSSIPVKELHSDYKQQGLLVFASISATVSSILWAISFTQTSVASSTVLRSLTPLFISLGAWLILKQQFDRQFLAGMALSIIGGVIIGWDDLQLGQEYLIGDAIALLSAALHGVNILTVGYLRDRHCTTARVLFWRCGFGSLIVLPLVWGTNTQFPVSIQGWLMVIALAIVCQTFGQGLLVYSLKQFSASFVGIFTLLKPIFTTLLAWIIFSESISLTSGMALILILVGIYLARDSANQ